MSEMRWWSKRKVTQYPSHLVMEGNEMAMQAHQRRYLAAAHLWRDADTRSLVEELPPSLRTAVVLHVEKGLLSKIPFFHGTRRSFVAEACLLYTSPSPRDQRGSRMPSSA